MKTFKMKPTKAGAQWTGSSVELTFIDVLRSVSAEIPLDTFVSLMDGILVRLSLTSRNPETHSRLHKSFGLADVGAFVHEDGQPMLKYVFESGIGMASAIEREKLQRLHAELGAALEATKPPVH